MFLSQFHQLFSVGGSIIRTIVCLIEDNVACIFELPSCTIFKPYIPVGCCETEENARGSMVLIQLGAAYTWLLDRDM